MLFVVFVFVFRFCYRFLYKKKCGLKGIKHIHFLLPLSNKVYFKLVTGDNCEVFPASVVNILVFNHGNVNFDFSYNGSYIYLAC